MKRPGSTETSRIWRSLEELLAGGCTQTRLTNPSRSAVEQLLLSAAADRAWALTEAIEINGRKVFVEERILTATTSSTRLAR